MLNKNLNLSSKIFSDNIDKTPTRDGYGEGLVEAGKAMGATPCQIIYKILLPEALPTIINGITITLITLVGYSAMAGAVGGGGLGEIAIDYGYQRFNTTIMLTTVLILIALVHLIQWTGEWWSKKLSH